jgi:hypothetical protein
MTRWQYSNSSKEINYMGTKIAHTRFEHVRDISNMVGVAWLIRDTTGFNHYVVSRVAGRADIFNHGDETMIFASDSTGHIYDWTDLYAGYGEDHETAILNFETQQGS